MNSFVLVLCCIGFLAGAVSTASAEQFEVYMTNLRPTGMTLNWDLTGRPNTGVMGFEFRVDSDLADEEDFQMTYAEQADGSKGTSIPTDWFVSCKETTRKCVGFSLQGTTASGLKGPIIEFEWLSMLATVDITSFSATDVQGEQINFSVQPPTRTDQPTLDVFFSQVKPGKIVVSTKLESWDEHAKVQKADINVYVTNGAGEVVEGGITSITQLAEVDGWDCSTTDNAVHNCKFDNLLPAEAELAAFEVQSGVYNFHLEGAESTLPASFRSVRHPLLEFDVKLENGGKIGIPKVGLGFLSVEPVMIEQPDTCGNSGEWCVHKEMKAVIGYRNYDATVTFAGFQFEIESPVSWLVGRAGLPSNLVEDGFSLSDNNRGTYVCFSMTAGAFIPLALEEPADLLYAYYERTVDEVTLRIRNEVVSDSYGGALNTIVYESPINPNAPDHYVEDKTGLGGSLRIISCDGVDPVGSDPDGFCDDEDFDCDCCLNNVDAFPDDASKGCGICGDVNNNDMVDIMDAVLDINMLVGIQTHDVQNGDANGDNKITVLDVVQIINQVLAGPGEEVKMRPCNLVE